MNTICRVAGVVLAVLLAAGCSKPILRETAQPSKTKDQYTRIKRIAILPFENYSDTKDADRTLDAILATAIREVNIFDDVEDTRFVRDVMRKLKITSTEIMDKEVIKKFGDEMNVQGIIYGKIVVFGKGKEKDSGSQVTMDMALVEPSTGKVLWIGNISAYGGLTAGKVFGVTEGMTDVEVARDAIRGLTTSLASEVRRARDGERRGTVADLRKEEDIERAKLEKLKGETGKIKEQLDKADAEAKSIKAKASKEAEAVKTELEMQKAALDSEKAKTTAAQQEIDQEKLKVEMEKKKIVDEMRKVEEEKKKLEEARKAAEEARKKAAQQEPVKEEAVKETAPQAPAAPAEPAETPGAQKP